MKISVFGINDFPFGKKALPDERLKKITEWYKAQKTTQIQVEFVTEKDLKISDAIVCLDEKKLDLVILDMEIVEGKLERQSAAEEAALLKRCQELLEKETPLVSGTFSEEEKKWLSNNNFVTVKPIIFISRADLEDLPSLVKKAYYEGGRICFLTGGVKEARAWEIKKNATAVEAAHAIHSDLARGFIRAEVMAYDDLLKVGNVNQAKTQGCLRQEGKDYIVSDGDVIEFKSGV
jgi:ribosome-binding ATPase YchF (GTP1/OBG family)